MQFPVHFSSVRLVVENLILFHVKQVKKQVTGNETKHDQDLEDIEELQRYMKLRRIFFFRKRSKAPASA